MSTINVLAHESIQTPSVAWTGLLPIIILATAGVLLLTICSLFPERVTNKFASVYTQLAASAALSSTFFLWDKVQNKSEGPYSTLAGAFGVDGFSIFVTMLLTVCVILISPLAENFLKKEKIDGPEPYVLMLLAATGGIIMAGANDFIILFLGIEVLSISSYILAAMNSRRIQSQEAGLKYFVLGAFASGFLLYGIALLYGATGSTSFSAIKNFTQEVELTNDTLLLASLALLIVGLGFKVAAVPFHFWSPDVYQGSPTPFVAFMASAVKAAGFAAILRVLYVTLGEYRADWQPAIYAIAIATLLTGSLLAIVQTDLKRMLAYSSISHAGYLLVGTQAASDQGVKAVLFYLATYAFMVIGSFTVIALNAGDSGTRTSLDSIAGLATKKPLLGIAFTIFLLGQAGIPLTSGFFAKFYVIEAAIEESSYMLAVIAMITAVIGAFLYLRILVKVWLTKPEESEENENIHIPNEIKIILGFTVFATMFLGIWPEPLVEMVQRAIPALIAG
jgi:NADH-quinone oxidoreductase subunit N